MRLSQVCAKTEPEAGLEQMQSACIYLAVEPVGEKGSESGKKETHVKESDQCFTISSNGTADCSADPATQVTGCCGTGKLSLGTVAGRSKG